MSVVLRPLSTSELLDRTFFLYRNNFLVFAGIATIPELPVLALRLGNSWIRATHIPVGRLTAIIVILVANYLALAISHAGTVIAVSDLHLEKVVTIRSAYATARRSLLRVIWISFVVTVAIPFLVGAPAAFLVAMLLAPLGMGNVRGFPVASLILVVAFFGSGCYWWLARAFVVPVTVLENARLRESMDRSLVLTADRRWRIFVICLLVVTLTWAVTAVFQLPAVTTGGLHFVRGRMTTNALSSVLLAVGSFVGTCLAGPLLTIALTLAYYDARVRKEGFDLQLMISNLWAMPESEAVARI